ncbi:MAG: hypothetical protein J6R23_03655 [Spirochaetales bacterium]|nr:hypothetical protein [Spirochaetales bacterium]
MKKILSIALVALLAVSSVFAADFSGSASINFGYDFESKAWGFANENSTKIDIKAEIASGSADKAGEGEIYAGIKAAFAVDYKIANSGVTASVSKNSISAAYITNGEWKVSILGATGPSDFAKSYYKVSNKNITFAPVADKAPGFTVEYAGYKASLGLAGNTAAKTIDWSASLATPAYTLAEGLTANFAVAAADNTDIAASANVAYDADVDASLAADFGYSTAAKALDFDVAAKVVVAPVTVDAYYWYGSKLLAAQVAASVDALTVTVGDKDILNANPITVAVEYKVSDALSVEADGSYTVASKAWSVGAAAEYAADAYTAKASAEYASAKTLEVAASVESAAVIPGATLKLAYAADDVLNEKYGAVNASCKIAF